MSFSMTRTLKKAGTDVIKVTTPRVKEKPLHKRHFKIIMTI